MKKFGFTFLLLLILPFCLKANMAQPYFDGVKNAAMYGNKNFSVSHEIIDIEIKKDSLQNHLYSVFKVHYKIKADENANIPLLFLALYNSSTHLIKVNGKIISSQKLTTQNANQFPFLSELKEENGSMNYIATYDKKFSVTVKLEDLIYFHAPLQKGENDVYIEYESDFGYTTYGFLRDYKLAYSLYPSQFWKSFGAIEVNLHLNGLAELTESNLGKAKIENDVAHWTLTSTDKDIDITLNHKTNLLGKFLLLLQPIGIAVLVFFGLAFLHCRWIKNYPKKRNWILWLGIFVIPAIFYVVFLGSYDLIDWVLGYYSKQGYIFLYVVTYPIFLIFYGLLIFLWKRWKFPKVTLP